MTTRWLPLSALMWSAAAALAQDPAPTDKLPQVEINALREKLSVMRARIVEAEDRFYEEYNKLNTTDDFDMVCNMETPMDSHRKSRVCRPVYVKKAVERESQGYLAGVTGPRLGEIDNPAPPANLTISARFGDFQKTMSSVIAKHPELKKLIRERDLLQREYEAVRRQKLEGRTVVLD